MMHQDSANAIRDRVRNLIGDIGEGIYEREETAAVALLSVLSGQSVFMYGPPGTAKSLIARRISCAFTDTEYFEHLMQRFSTPEDVFGPVSISELRQDRYARKTELYLPSADIAFLDEIWKSSPAILNTLLTIVNERKFRNGGVLEDVPLKALIAASNEFPPVGSGLEALYDRFIVRLKVSPVRDRANFERMVSTSRAADSVVSAHAFSTAEWKDMMTAAELVSVPTAVFDIVDRIKTAIDGYNGKMAPADRIYVSDRRWQKAFSVIRNAAYLDGRDEVAPADLLLLCHCLWSKECEIEITEKMVIAAVSETAMADRGASDSWKASFAEFEREVRGAMFHKRTVYESVPIGGAECIRCAGTVKDFYDQWDLTLYIPACRMYSGDPDPGIPFDDNGNPAKGFSFRVVSGPAEDPERMKVEIRKTYNDSGFDTEPVIKHRAGDVKEITERETRTFAAAAGRLMDEISGMIADAESRVVSLSAASGSIFTSGVKREAMLSAADCHIAGLRDDRARVDNIIDMVKARGNLRSTRGA